MKSIKLTRVGKIIERTLKESWEKFISIALRLKYAYLKLLVFIIGKSNLPIATSSQPQLFISLKIMHMLRRPLTVFKNMTICLVDLFYRCKLLTRVRRHFC